MHLEHVGLTIRVRHAPHLAGTLSQHRDQAAPQAAGEVAGFAWSAGPWRPRLGSGLPRAGLPTSGSSMGARHPWRETEPIRMKCLLMFLPGLCVLVLTVSLSIAIPRSNGFIYTVAELRERLARQPSDRVGQNLLVQGTVEACGAYDRSLAYCLGPQAAVDGADADPLPLLWTAPDPIQALLDHLLFLRGAAYVRQAVAVGQEGVYRSGYGRRQTTAAAGSMPATRPCCSTQSPARRGSTSG